GTERVTIRSPAVAPGGTVREHPGEQQVGRVRDLERGRLAVDRGHGDTLASEQLRLVPERLGALGPRLDRRREEVPACTLGRLGARDAAPVDETADDAIR